MTLQYWHKSFLKSGPEMCHDFGMSLKASRVIAEVLVATYLFKLKFYIHELKSILSVSFTLCTGLVLIEAEFLKLHFGHKRRL